MFLFQSSNDWKVVLQMKVSTKSSDGILLWYECEHDSASKCFMSIFVKDGNVCYQ